MSMPGENPFKRWTTKSEKVFKRAILIIVTGFAVAVSAITIWEVFDPVHENSALTKAQHKFEDLPFHITDKDVILNIGSTCYLKLIPSKALKKRAEVKIEFDDPSVIDTMESFAVSENSMTEIVIPLHSAKVAGHCTVTFTSKSKELKNLYKLQVYVKVVHFIPLGYLSIILGWGYFLCWSMVYYPQIYKNFKRKSVIGLSFDYLALNLTGHVCYCVFNTTMFYSSHVQIQYTKLHPKGLLPVKFNDVLFSWHAVAMNLILVVQCVIYDRGEQQISVPNIALVSGLWFSIVSGLIAGGSHWISWLKCLYFLSYIKVSTTPIKYAPQVYLHYLKKSTEGWSIYSVLFDLSGGILSFLQMTIDAFNNDDIDETYGNPGKLGLSVIAVMFDSIFLYQHYKLYPSKRHSIMELHVPKKSDALTQPSFFTRLSSTRRIPSNPKIVTL